VKAQYRQTLLGYLWAFLPPLFMSAVWVFLYRQRVFTIGDTGMPYPLFVLTGMVLWQTFVDAVNSPLKLINESKAMLVKVNFPHEALILAGLGEVLFNFLVRSFVLVPAYIYYEFPLPLTVLAAPAGVMSLMSLGLMTGILLTPLGILYADISRGLQLIIQVWFFLTPVIYPVTAGTFAINLIGVNPVTPILVTTRDWLTTGNYSLLPEFFFVTFLTMLLLFAGWVVFRLAMPHLLSRINV
jgi:lipopolysaccharide transport system permease protein